MVHLQRLSIQRLLTKAWAGYRNQRVLKHPETSKRGKAFGQKAEIVFPGRPGPGGHPSTTIIITGHNHPQNHGANAGREW